MRSKISKSTHRLGIIVLLGAALLTSASQVFYAHQVQTIHPFLFTGISFFLTTVFFQLLSFRAPKKVHKGTLIPIIQLNIASAITFMSFYFALKYVEPAIVSSLEIGIAPLFVLAMHVLRKMSIPSRNWLIAAGTLLACIILIFGTSQSSLFQEGVIHYVIIGLIASCICGIGAVYCADYSKTLSDLGWSSTKILSQRYLLIIFISFFFTYDLIIPYFKENISWIVVMTIFGVLLPNYLLQKGIQYTNTFLVMMSLSFIPIFTFIFQRIDTRIDFSPYTAVGVALLFIFGLFSLKKPVEG